MAGKFILEMPDFHVEFRNLLHGTPQLYFPSEGRRADDFFRIEKSDGFGRV
jgi:hypothetical protein